MPHIAENSTVIMGNNDSIITVMISNSELVMISNKIVITVNLCVE